MMGLIFTIILGASLFLSYWGLDWPMAWVYLGLFVAGQVIVGVMLVPNNPALVSERTQARERVTGPDRILSGLITLYGPVSTLIVAGLDRRLAWSPHVPPALIIVAVIVAALGNLLTIWAMAANRFFYGSIRIDKDQGHTVTTSGPFQFVRHPGYVGGMLWAIATPFMLGSLWSLIPAVLTLCAFVARTAFEDRTLQEGLEGYKDYAGRVRYRLVPSIW
jgi:protein-S-isoprenylcysteine O-methyltransferase Ste14